MSPNYILSVTITITNDQLIKIDNCSSKWKYQEKKRVQRNIAFQFQDAHLVNISHVQKFITPISWHRLVRLKNWFLFVVETYKVHAIKKRFFTSTKMVNNISESKTAC